MIPAAVSVNAPVKIFFLFKRVPPKKFFLLNIYEADGEIRQTRFFAIEFSERNEK